MIKLQITRSNKFIKIYEKLDKSIKIKADKILEKITDNPEIGKPMQYSRKGTRELYIKPFRFSYKYVKEIDTIYLLNLYHKDEQ